MQVYRGLDIGTAKPSPADRARVPHHLIDICDLQEGFDAAQFVRRARQAVAEIQSRRKIPVFCGGTGLYFKAFLNGLGEAPPANPELRAELEMLPFEALLRELRERDPAAYEKIDKQNPRRVIRAVEVIRLSGKKFSEQRAEWKTSKRGWRIEDGRRPTQQTSLIHHPCSILAVHLSHAATGRFAQSHQRPGGRNVLARSGGGDARIAPARSRGKQNGDAGHRLSAGGGAFARRTESGGDHRAGENSNAAVCQTATDVVPPPRKLRVDCIEAG